MFKAEENEWKNNVLGESEENFVTNGNLVGVGQFTMAMAMLSGGMGAPAVG